jgi:hypothetical protein
LLTDYHTHIAGVGTGGSGCCVNRSCFQPFLHPINTAKRKVFMRCAGVTDAATADAQYVDRLVGLIQDIKNSGLPWGKHAVLAMDAFFEVDGTMNMEKTGMYTPNSYVESVVSAHRDLFFMCASVHPYRTDAIQELNRLADLGVKMCKWLPNSMGIDLSHEKCTPVYETLRERNIVLLIHTGEEHAGSVCA